MLEAQLFSNYYMLETQLGTKDKLNEYNQQTYSNFMTVKKSFLKQMYICALYSEYEYAKTLSQAILDELLQTSDTTQLSLREI